MAHLLFTSSWTSLVFEGRNKFYGAFDLRQSYERHMLIALFITILFIGIFSLGTFWVKSPEVHISQVLGPEIILADIKPDETIYTLAKSKATVNQVIKPKTSGFDAPTPVETTNLTSHTSESSTSATSTDATEIETGMGIVSSTPNEDGGSDSENTYPAGSETSTNTETVSFAEVMPVFNGNMQAFIASHFNYPGEAISHNVEGKMILELVLDESGKVSKAKILRSLGFGCDEEALRVVLSMPAWQPAKVGGRPVKIKLSIPITLKLANN